jgi:hypothetical protein
MSVPGDPTREQPAVQPTISTEPAPGTPHRWWSAIPRHLGRARTSTVVLVVLFLATGVLYLYVKPEQASASARTVGDPAVDEPATTTGGETTAPPTTGPPTTTVPVEPTTSEETTSEETTSAVPEETTVPEDTTTETVPPPTTETTSVPPLPTTSEPTG